MTAPTPAWCPSPVEISNIQVCIRLRPIKSTPNSNLNPDGIWVLNNNTISQTEDTDFSYAETSKLVAYNFDKLYDYTSTTANIYTDVCRGVVKASMAGYHGSIFAYGQTSTGKTFTMQGTHDQPGIVPMAVNECFNYIKNCTDVDAYGGDSRSYLLRMSYLEIYNEQINDLLS